MSRRRAERRAPVVAMAVVACLIGFAFVATTGPAEAAGPTMTPTSFNFGDLHVGRTKSTTVKVTVPSGYRFKSADAPALPDQADNHVVFPFAITHRSSDCAFAGPVTCTLTVTFAPDHVEKYTGLTMFVRVCPTGQTTCQPITSTWAGNATPAATAVKSLDLGGSPEGKAVKKSIDVTLDPLYTVTQFYWQQAPDDNPFAIVDTAPNCAQPGGTCTIYPRFRPNVLGKVTVELEVQACRIPAAGPPLCTLLPIALSGTGTAPATLSVTSIAFPATHAGLTVARPLTVSVLGSWHVQDVVVQTTSVGFAQFDHADAPLACENNGPRTCTISVTYTPTYVGAVKGTVRVVLCDSTMVHCWISSAVALSGTGVSPATVSPTSVAFGNVKVGTRLSKPVAVKLDPGWSVHDVEFVTTAPGNQFYAGLDGACGGPTCTFGTFYDPTTIGAVTATMRITVCNTDATICLAVTSVKLTGTGLAPATVSPTSLSFGSVVAGRTAAKPLVVKTDPGWFVSSVSGLGATGYSEGYPYGQVWDLSGTESCGPASCTFSQRFYPRGAKTFNATTVFQVCNDGSGLCVDLPPVKLSGTSTLTATTTKLTAPSTTFPHGLPAVLNVAVTPSPNEGTVTVYDGGSVLCGGLHLDGSGRASCLWQNPATGSHALKAVFSGGIFYKTSTGTLTATVK